VVREFLINGMERANHSCVGCPIGYDCKEYLMGKWESDHWLLQKP